MRRNVSTSGTAAHAIRASLGGIAMVVALASPPAKGQTLDQVLPPDLAGVAVEPDVTVQSRRRPAYDALGIRAGAFIIRPTLDESAGYETNVLGTSKPKGSPIFETSAGLSAATDQSRNSLSGSISVDDVRYTDQPSQSFTNWTARLGGSHNLGRDIVDVQYAHLNLSETLQDLGVSQQLTKALSYRIDDGRISYRSEFARTFVVPALEVVNYAYDNLVSGGTVYQQGYRNRVEVQPSVTLGYELAPRRNLIVVGRGGVADYASTQSGVAKRNYGEATILGGIDYDLNGIVRLRMLAGYQTRSFQSSQYRSVNAPVVEGSLIWNPTGLTSVTGTVSRTIQDSADATRSAVKETVAGLRVDHELYRNILLKASANYAVDEYPDTGNQTLYGVGAGATYLLNRNMSLAATYDFSRRSSGARDLNIGLTGQSLGPGYSDHRIQLQLRLRL